MLTLNTIYDIKGKKVCEQCEEYHTSICNLKIGNHYYMVESQHQRFPRKIKK